MTEENDFFERNIKKYSSAEIQRAISAALSELLCEEYEVDIKTINYNHDNTSLLLDSTEFNLVVHKKIKIK